MYTKRLIQISINIISFALWFQIERFNAFRFFLPIKVIEFPFFVTVQSNGNKICINFARILLFYLRLCRKFSLLLFIVEIVFVIL